MNIQGAPEWLPTYLVPFFTLSYPSARPEAPDSFATSSYYTTGFLDGCFIITCIAIMALLRDIFRVFALEPFAHWFLTRKQQSYEPLKDVVNGSAGGVSNGNGHVNAEEKSDALRKRRREERVVQRSVLRFAEQGWSVIYYSIQWAFGLYIHCNLPTAPFKPSLVWLNYPHIPLPGPVKLYYLTQTAFYMHQVLILNAEARRKDHWQMMAHHVITIVLVVLSYFYNLTRVGSLIMVLMDYCDIFLPLAKMLRYLSLQKICDAMFTWFLISWFITRHFFFILVIKSLYSDGSTLIPFIWSPEDNHYWTYEIWMGFLALLISLQFIQIIWFGMICNVAWRVISGQNAEDVRSDDEG
ncbi:longevity assurance proteins LAG1/LAC1 [Fomitiporia mediterranea MF3/22]|uniref:longevity assurance proteins LAG1/LAC1 n=1 Tax=Fomitiporia mediterranea (strain MF3/22) TaxID=694068 RepID=UPI0004408AFB|nr:longevity assurance proteins LAG1/LAC1 [Fomitiporia mediterranea MF3/22]EJD01170.1 longevity assurance proteins LAG1/LAC1 [Fomitiporia mediterranea MF3/22]